MAADAGSSWARRRGAAIAATLVAPFLLYLIVRMIPAPLPPEDPVVAARKAMFESIVPTFRVRDREIALARRAGQASPLAYEPFFLLARAAEQRGDHQAAIRLMEEVRRRRANFVPGRLQLAAYYGATNQFRRMFDEIDVALRLNSDVREAVVAELTRLIAIPDGRDELAGALARNPSWRRDFFVAAHGRPFSPADTRALYRAVRARNPQLNATPEFRLHLEALVRTGQVARARNLWLDAMPPDRRQRHANLFDGDFSGQPAFPPFGWELAETEQGRAEIMRDGRPHLQVDYFGGSNEVLAEQVIALRPGNYRLTYVARSDDGVRGANLNWVIACYPSGAILSRTVVQNLGQNYQRRGIAFAIPASAQCNGQVLRLVGEPGDVSVPVSFQLGSVGIAR
jgi:hypothetical protein